MISKISINAAENVDKSVETLKIIYKNFENIIEIARKIAAKFPPGLTYDEAKEKLLLLSVDVFDGGYMIDFIDAINIYDINRSHDSLLAVFGSVESGHNDQAVWHF